MSSMVDFGLTATCEAKSTVGEMMNAGVGLDVAMEAARAVNATGNHVPRAERHKVSASNPYGHD